MRHFRVISPLLGFALALVTASLTQGASVAVVPESQHNFGITSEQLLSSSAIDSGGHSVEGLVTTAFASVDEVGRPIDRYPLIDGSGKGDAEQEPDMSDVVRHRGFRKAFLVLLVCGGLIRFLTSPTYLNFIADALDPKASF